MVVLEFLLDFKVLMLMSCIVVKESWLLDVLSDKETSCRLADSWSVSDCDLDAAFDPEVPFIIASNLASDPPALMSSANDPVNDGLVFTLSAPSDFEWLGTTLEWEDLAPFTRMCTVDSALASSSPSSDILSKSSETRGCWWWWWFFWKRIKEQISRVSFRRNETLLMRV